MLANWGLAYLSDFFFNFLKLKCFFLIIIKNFRVTQSQSIRWLNRAPLSFHFRRLTSIKKTPTVVNVVRPETSLAMPNRSQFKSLSQKRGKPKLHPRFYFFMKSMFNSFTTRYICFVLCLPGLVKLPVNYIRESYVLNLNLESPSLELLTWGVILWTSWTFFDESRVA